MSKKLLTYSMLALSTLVGCSQAPAPNAPSQPSAPQQLAPAGGVPTLDAGAVQPPPADCPVPAVPIWNADCRFIAFSACREHDKAGSLFLWDDAIKDVYILNAALAGLNSQFLNKQVAGPDSCSELETMNPYAFADGKILFSWDHYVYVYDMVAEERVTVAIDGQAACFGGPRAKVTADGHLLAYISDRGTVVLKETDGIFFTKTRELAKIAAEANALYNNECRQGVIYDLDISGDGRWLVVNIDGLLFLYDVAMPHLYQLLPLSGSALAGQADRIGHVAINLDGRFIAFTVNDRIVTRQLRRGRGSDGIVGNDDQRLLVLDRQTGLIDTVPYANLGDTLTGSRHGTIVANPVFCNDGRSLLFETVVGRRFHVWDYDLLNETLRGLVILNNVLGSAVDDTLISDPGLDP